MVDLNVCRGELGLEAGDDELEFVDLGEEGSDGRVAFGAGAPGRELGGQRRQ